MTGPSMNFTKFTLPQIAEQWRVKLHWTNYKCGSGWLSTERKADVTCGRCLTAIAKAGPSKETK